MILILMLLLIIMHCNIVIITGTIITRVNFEVVDYLPVHKRAHGVGC